ncbi:MAG: hypothetical protein ACR2QM_20875 [Longimicrobiales bacterium]
MSKRNYVRTVDLSSHTSAVEDQDGEAGKAEPQVIPFPPPLESSEVAKYSGVACDSYAVEVDRNGMALATVVLSRNDEAQVGEARGTSSTERRPRLIAEATLAAVSSFSNLGPRRFQNLRLHGVKEVTVFGRCLVLVAVHAVRDREMISSTGTADVEDSRESAVIAATLQATDRWVQGPV